MASLSDLNDEDYAAYKAGNLAAMSDDGYNLAKQITLGQPSAAPTAKPEYGMPEAALQGFGQGASFGYLPQLQAAANKLYEPNTPYSDLLKNWQVRNKNVEDENPITTGATKLAGNIAMTAPLAAAKGLPLLARVAQATGIGAGTAALQNPDEDDTSGETKLDLAKRGANALTGGAMGFGGQALAEGANSAANLLSKTGKWLQGSRVTSQLGANASQLKSILEKDQVPQLEKFMTKEGFMDPGQDVDSIREGTKKIINEEGPKIGQIYDSAKKKANNIKEILGGFDHSDIQIDGNDLADEIESQAQKDFKNHTKRDTILSQVKSSLQPLRDMGDNADFSAVHDFRKSLDEQVDWNKSTQELPAIQDYYKNARTAVNKKIQDTIGNIDYVLGSDDPLVSQLRNSNQRFSNASIANAISTKASAREGVKAWMGAGALGGMVGVPTAYATYNKTDSLPAAAAAGIGAGALTALSRRYGNPAGYAAGNLMQKIPALTEPLTKAPGAVGAAAGQISPWLDLGK